MPKKTTHTRMEIDIPTHRHRAIEEQATLQGISISDYVIGCIQEAFDKSGFSAEEIAAAMKAEDAKSKKLAKTSKRKK